MSDNNEEASVCGFKTVVVVVSSPESCPGLAKYHPAGASLCHRTDTGPRSINQSRRHFWHLASGTVSLEWLANDQFHFVSEMMRKYVLASAKHCTHLKAYKGLHCNLLLMECYLSRQLHEPFSSASTGLSSTQSSSGDQHTQNMDIKSNDSTRKRENPCANDQKYACMDTQSSTERQRNKGGIWQPVPDDMHLSGDKDGQQKEDKTVCNIAIKDPLAVGSSTHTETSTDAETERIDARTLHSVNNPSEPEDPSNVDVTTTDVTEAVPSPERAGKGFCDENNDDQTSLRKATGAGWISPVPSDDASLGSDLHSSDHHGKSSPKTTGSKDRERKIEDSEVSLQDSSGFPDKSPSTGKGGSKEESGTGWEEERVGRVVLFGVPIVSLHVQGGERLCLAQISSLLLQDFSYNEIHNRRVALGITCLQCTPSQLEVLRRAGAMPVSSRRCGLITKREAERLVRSFIADVPPPRLPDNFTFKVRHSCGWGCEGVFVPARYNSSRAKCIKCSACHAYFSPNKFIFHFHRTPSATYRHPDAANFNSWRRHLELAHDGNDERLLHVWEDVKAMFNGGCRKRFSVSSSSSIFSPGHSSSHTSLSSSSRESFSSSTLRRNFSVSDNPSPYVLSQPPVQKDARNSRISSATQNTKPISQMSSHLPIGAGGPSLLPYTNLAGPHHALFNPGLGSVVSYGEFLRSMSLPYTSNNVMASTANAGFMQDWYRSHPGSLLPGNSPGVFGGTPYPLPYFGYSPYVAPPKDGHDRNQACFRQSLSAIPNFSIRNENAQFVMNNTNVCDQDSNTGFHNATSERRNSSVPPERENNNKQNAEEDRTVLLEVNENATSQDSFCKETSANCEELGKASESPEKAGGEGEGKDLKVKDVSSSSGDKTREDVDNRIASKKAGEDLQSTIYADKTPVCKARDEKSDLLQKDTESLLELFEESENIDMFLQLPMDRLRRLLKTAKTKSQAVEREHQKITGDD
ncbi:hypothetical protein BaRGS_00011817 [Batillaria attramentaria]|uniref:c-SKI SMAD4-binding domain-containing protein n=1 Tax=Batillaria attramentaria TaxID=370345 RepID=A0ABD0LBR6_9CAEN